MPVQALARAREQVHRVCDYCDCRDIAPVKELSDDHERIGSLAGELRRRLRQDGEGPAGAVLAELQTALAPHLAREETGIFAQLAARPGFEWYLGQLEADHHRARAVLLSADPAGSGWAAEVLVGLDELAKHIEVEEYDLFPASRVVIDDAGWGRVMAVHRELSGSALAGATTHGPNGPAITRGEHEL
jgi:hypothetical protein